MLLSTAYFPPIEYFAVLARCSVVYMEACENYQKQTYRNRCRILVPDGVQRLQVPVEHRDGIYELPITEIRVDYSTPWIVRTERCLDAAYKSSAFYDYYRGSLFEILDSKPETLWELNLSIIEYLCGKIGINPSLRATASFARPGTVEDDLRAAIHPKYPGRLPEAYRLGKPYYQVFSDRIPFVPGLSVIDLLFNEGPESICHLR